MPLLFVFKLFHQKISNNGFIHGTDVVFTYGQAINSTGALLANSAGHYAKLKVQFLLNYLKPLNNI
jgi:hypothetical protein